MKTHARWFAAVFLIGWSAPVGAQVPSTVQLPSFSSFGVSTTVSVPDRGPTRVGGVRRSSSGYTAYGPSLGPRSRSYGRQTSASNVDLRVQVHHLDSMDKQLLGQAESGKPASRKPPRSAPSGASSAEQAPQGSLADARRQRAAEVEAEEQQALDYIRQAKRASERGKPKVAKVIYEMAERRASADLKVQIRHEIAALKDAEAAVAVTRDKPKAAH